NKKNRKRKGQKIGLDPNGIRKIENARVKKWVLTLAK
ncbi:hypothetical protein HMPREF9709_00220, partial [Helcococcus kunzii ATCC 51366]